MRKTLTMIFAMMSTSAGLFVNAGAASAKEAPPAIPILEEISASHAASARADLITFRFRDIPPTCTAAYVPRSELIADASGQRLFVPGRSFVKVVCQPAAAHDEQGQPTAPRKFFSANTTNVIKIIIGGDFEAVLTYFVGLRERQPAPPVNPTVSVQDHTVVVGVPTHAECHREWEMMDSPRCCEDESTESGK